MFFIICEGVERGLKQKLIRVSLLGKCQVRQLVVMSGINKKISDTEMEIMYIMYI